MLTVCDGMGGHEAGELAARTAVEVFTAQFKEQKPAIDAAPAFLRDAMEQAHQEVVRAGIRKPLDHRPRTTATLCAIPAAQAGRAPVADRRRSLPRRHEVARRTLG